VTSTTSFDINSNVIAGLRVGERALKMKVNIASATVQTNYQRTLLWGQASVLTNTGLTEYAVPIEFDLPNIQERIFWISGQSTNNKYDTHFIYTDGYTNHTYNSITWAPNIQCSNPTMLYGFGSNYQSPLGDGTAATPKYYTSVVMTGVLANLNLVILKSLSMYTMVVSTEGKFYGWGNGANYNLGDGSTTPTNRLSPTTGANTLWIKSKFVVMLECGYYVCVGLTSDHILFGFGAQVNNGPPIQMQTGEIGVDLITQITCGYSTQLFLTENGRAYARGANEQGQMGVASIALGAAYTSTIRAITGTLTTKVVTKLSSGFRHSMALTSDAKVFVWGSIGLSYSGTPTYSGPGDGTGTGSNIPVLIDNSVFENKIAIDVSSGWFNAMVLTSDGSIFAAGINTNYQLGGTCYIIF
jgi:hypothetical protein